MTSKPSHNKGASESSIDKAARHGAFVFRPIAELKRATNNPRLHSKRQIRQIAESIKTFGFLVPIVVDRHGNVIAGHGRIMAAELLGLTEVPTICVDHLSEAQIKAFRLADNRLGEISVWNDRLLAEQLKELSVLDLDFDLEVTGFETGEIDLRIEELTSEPQGGNDPADILLAPQAGSPVTQLGDLWLLARHRICCRSAVEDAAYLDLMQGKKAATVFTDPPYNVPIKGNVSGLGSIEHREFVMASGEMSELEFIAFLRSFLSPLVQHSVAGSLSFICIDWRHVFAVLVAAREVQIQLINLCVWDKGNGGMGSLYRSQHELVFVFRNGRKSHRNNIQLGRFGRNRTNVWRYPGANSFARHSDEGNLLALHPTVKPVQLVADAIMDCSARGDIVLDPFLGSGTTVIATERTGRRCYGLELDPLYVDTIIRRWQTFTGDSARHAASGRTFCDLEAEARKDDGD